MIERLYLNGCSWVEGHLLHEEEKVLDYAKSIGFEFKSMFYATKRRDLTVEYGKSFKEFYNKFNLAEYISKDLNINEVYNDSEGAGSNARIVRTTVDYVKQLTAEQKEKTLIVIGWTMPERNEIFLDDKTGLSAWCKFNLTQRFSELDHKRLNTNFVKRIDKFWEQYVVDVHTFYYSIKKFFEQSCLLANFLENNNIKYYFFNTFPILWGYNDLYNDYELMEEIKKDMDYYNNNFFAENLNTTFEEFIKNIPNCHLSDRHPNSLGYKLWAEHILKNMKQKGIV